MVVTVQPAKEDDVKQIKQVLSETWIDTYHSFIPVEVIHKITALWHSPETLAAEIETENVYFALAKDENSAILGLLSRPAATTKSLPSAASTSCPPTSVAASAPYCSTPASPPSPAPANSASKSKPKTQKASPSTANRASKSLPASRRPSKTLNSRPLKWNCNCQDNAHPGTLPFAAGSVRP